MAGIQVEHLNFAYPGQRRAALRDVSFSVEEGEFLVVLGPSGGGKSTLLRLLKPSLRLTAHAPVRSPFSDSRWRLWTSGARHRRRVCPATPGQSDRHRQGLARIGLRHGEPGL